MRERKERRRRRRRRERRRRWRRERRRRRGGRIEEDLYCPFAMPYSYIGFICCSF